MRWFLLILILLVGCAGKPYDFLADPEIIILVDQGYLVPSHSTSFLLIHDRKTRVRAFFDQAILLEEMCLVPWAQMKRLEEKAKKRNGK